MELSATELRIGNHVYNNYEKFITIRGLILNECFSDISGYSYEEIEPIPLSEEWLLRFGFENFSDWQIALDDPSRFLVIMHVTHSGDEFYPVLEQCGEVSSERKQIFHLNRIQYVHQLQNLYFALTGTELTIKP